MARLNAGGWLLLLLYASLCTVSARIDLDALQHLRDNLQHLKESRGEETLPVIRSYDIPHPTARQWIVITSIAAPTLAVQRLAALPDWKVVVVGDVKSPPPEEYRVDNVIFLDIDRQKQLPYSIVEQLPYRSYTRKMIGYLYAIEHGARVIYETDDDNLLTENLSNFLGNYSRHILHYAPPRVEGNADDAVLPVVNPYAYFGHPSVWPRGYPLEALDRTTQRTFYYSEAFPWIQQRLANGDPDVDCIFRLTRKLREYSAPTIHRTRCTTTTLSGPSSYQTA